MNIPYPGLHQKTQFIEDYADAHALGMYGGRILTLDRLALAAERRLSVVCPSWWPWRKPKPAAFIIHLSGHVLNRMINDGLYIYQKGSYGKF